MLVLPHHNCTRHTEHGDQRRALKVSSFQTYSLLLLPNSSFGALRAETKLRLLSVHLDARRAERAETFRCGLPHAGNGVRLACVNGWVALLCFR